MRGDAGALDVRAQAGRVLDAALLGFRDGALAYVDEGIHNLLGESGPRYVQAPRFSLGESKRGSR